MKFLQIFSCKLNNLIKSESHIIQHTNKFIFSQSFRFKIITLFTGTVEKGISEIPLKGILQSLHLLFIKEHRSEILF